MISNAQAVHELTERIKEIRSSYTLWLEHRREPRTNYIGTMNEHWARYERALWELANDWTKVEQLLDSLGVQK